MTQEEKAQRYNEALKKANIAYKDEDRHLKAVLERIFPELKNNKKEWIEKIRQELKSYLNHREVKQISESDAILQWITWLEKQGKKEQDVRYKHLEELLAADDIYQMAMNDTMIEEARTKAIEAISKIGISQLLGIEKQGEQNLIMADSPQLGEQKFTKFKVGDWVVFNNRHQSIYQVEKIEDGYYILRHTNGGTFRVCVLHDKSLRFWTIQDAKDGDVLAGNYGTFILMDKSKGGYCGVLNNNTFIRYTGNNEWTEDLHPTTKEQRDLLFKKMKEAGWEVDFEKKELKKIEVELTDFEKSLKHIMIETLECGDTRNLKADAEMLLRLAQNPTKWSEEDERNIQNIDAVLFYDMKLPEDTCVKLRDFLKTLKERIEG